MSANFPAIGNAGNIEGGGGGTPLGIEQNIFTAGTRAEAEAARDAYATANPNWLDSYNENKDENIRLDYVDAQGNSIAVFQVRNSAGTRWNDNDTVIGLRGATGDAASLANVRLGHVPVKTSDNTFGDSGVEILEDGTVRIPEATLGIGDLIELSEATGFGIIYNNVDQAGYVLLDARLSESAGSSRPRQFVIGTPSPTPFESGGTDVLTANPLVFTRTLTGTGANFSLTFQTDSAMANAKMRIVDAQTGVVFKHVPSRIAWEDDTVAGYNLRGGMNTIDFYSKEDDDPANGVFNFGISPLVFVAGRQLRIEIKADSVALIGDAGTQMPNFSGQFGAGTFTDIAYHTDILDAAGTRDLLMTLTGDDRLDASAIKGLQGGTAPVEVRPSFTRFEFQTQPTSVSPGTTISGLKTFLIRIDRPDLLTGHLTIKQGDDILTENTILPTVTSAGVPINSVTLTNPGDTVTFTIEATLIAGGMITDHITIRVPQPHEFAYWGIRTSDDFATTTLTNLNSVDVTTNNSFTVNGAFANTNVIGILVPSTHDVREITTFNLPVKSQFTRTNNARVINSVNYILYTLTNSGGIDGQATYIVEV